MAGGVVVFDIEEWRRKYPQFDKMSDEEVQTCFDRACMLLDNTAESKVKNLTERALLLDLLTCHIATLKERGDAPLAVLTGATEGSVSTSYTALNDKNWYTLTPCGYLFWVATAKYRQGVRWYCGC